MTGTKARGRYPLIFAVCSCWLALGPAVAGEGVDPNASFHQTESAPQAAPAPSKPTAPAPVERAQRAPAAARKAALAPPTVQRALLPAPGETRFRPDEVVVELSERLPTAAIDALRRRHRLDELQTARIALIGEDLHVWRAADGRSTGALLRELNGEPLIAAAQPNYVYGLQDADGPTVAAQYALGKLRIDVARNLATGDRVLVAMVDTAVDDSHPDLKDAIVANGSALVRPIRGRASESARCYQVPPCWGGAA